MAWKAIKTVKDNVCFLIGLMSEVKNKKPEQYSGFSRLIAINFLTNSVVKLNLFIIIAY